jgi:hypothetical protein
VANHLYAHGPLVFSEESHKGITDLKAFLLANVNDERTYKLLWTTLLNIFSVGYISKTIDMSTNEQSLLQNALAIVKRFGVLCHYLKNMCQQHFKPRFGVMIDNFIQIVNSRRLVTHDKLLSRVDISQVLNEVAKASAFTQPSIKQDIEAATKDNEAI